MSSDNKSSQKLRLFASILLTCVSAVGQSLNTATPAQASMPAAPALSAPTAPESPTDVPVVYQTDYAIASMVQRDSMLLWISYENCLTPGSEFGPPCKIRSKPIAGGTVRTIFDNTPTGPNFIASNNLAVDDQYVYWASASGNIVRHSRSASGVYSPTVVSPLESVSTGIEVAVDNTYVYWFENTIVNPAASKVFRALKAGGPREVMRTYDNRLRELQADGNGAVYFIHAGIFIIPNILFKAAPDVGGTFTETVIAGTVNSYALSSSDIFWAEGFSTNNRLVKSAPRNNPTSITTRATVAGTGSPTLREMAVDGNNIYWQEYRSPNGQVYRLALTPATGGTPQAITGAPSTVLDLVSAGGNLFWQAGDQILRLPTTASAFTRDLTANAATMEVIQAIQSPIGDVPLVAGKETFVRVYGRILASSSGEASLNPFPLVQLTGTRGGNPLPESPLRPTNFLPINTTPADRTTLNNWLFRLPASWTDGTVTLRAEVNPRRVLNETSFANHTASQTVTFNRKQTLCLDMIPVQTVAGTIGGYSPAYDSHFARAASMSAVAGYRTIWRGGSPHRRPRIPFGLFGSDPYNIDSDFELNYLMFNLWGAFLFSSDPSSCGGLRTVRTAALPAANRYGISSGAGSIIAFLLDYGGSAVNAPTGGTKGLVHELGHQHGRDHVNCGGPGGIDSSYPYPGCQFDNVGPNQHIGLDPITRRLLLPATSPDYMSYGPDPLWTSDYTFKAVFNNLRNATLLASVAQPSSALRGVQRVTVGEKLMISGMITGTGPNSAVLGYANLLSAAAVAEALAHLNDSASTSPDYTLRAFDAGGGLISSAALSTTTTHNHSDDEITLFTGFVDPNPAIVRFQVVNASNVPLGARLAGAATPIISITNPTGASNIGNVMNVSWNASDADGDALLFTLRYSNDNGATWRVLGNPIGGNSLNVDMTDGLPGGTQALLQVVASDGVHSSSATVGPFVVQRRAPVAAILDEAHNPLNASITAAATQSETIVLRGSAQDAEDGPLAGASLQWQLTGPITRIGDGEQLTLIGLPPGTYAVQMTAKDSDNAMGVATTTLTISPKRVFDSSAAIAVDGFCDEAAYNDELDPITLRYSDDAQTGVRFAHANSALYACFEGMPVGAMLNSFVGLRLDLNNSAGAKPQSDDRGFFIGRDGAPTSATGNGTDLIPDALPDGVTGAVSQNEAGTSWNAELRIEESKLGGWNKLIRMKVGHYWRDFGGDDSNWPNPSVYDIPSTWGLTALGQLTQTITFGALSNRALSDSPVAVSASASSGLPVSFSTLTPSVCTVNGATVTLLSAGTCTIRAAQTGNTSYGAAASVDRSFTVSANRPVFMPLLAR